MPRIKVSDAVSSTDMATHDKASTRTVDDVDPKRRRQNWSTKIDPLTGETLRFCSHCKDYLPLDKFHAFVFKYGTLICKTHMRRDNHAAALRWTRKHRGKRGSVARVRCNINRWMADKHVRGARWSEADVLEALRRHGVDLAAETRLVRMRPRDPNEPFDVDNSVVKFQNGSCASPRPTSNNNNTK